MCLHMAITVEAHAVVSRAQPTLGTRQDVMDFSAWLFAEYTTLSIPLSDMGADYLGKIVAFALFGTFIALLPPCCGSFFHSRS
jgi:hypothetical protein